MGQRLMEEKSDLCPHRRREGLSVTARTQPRAAEESTVRPEALTVGDVASPLCTQETALPVELGGLVVAAGVQWGEAGAAAEHLVKYMSSHIRELYSPIVIAARLRKS